MRCGMSKSVRAQQGGPGFRSVTTWVRHGMKQVEGHERGHRMNLATLDRLPVLPVKARNAVAEKGSPGFEAPLRGGEVWGEA